MDQIFRYFSEVNAVVNAPKALLNEKEIPQVLHEFYEQIGSVDLPYGRIYDIDLALANSKRMPFYPNWFVFGQDNYTSFWICTKKDNVDGCYFTYWDHDSGLDIEEPVWEDLLSFLKEMEEDSEID